MKRTKSAELAAEKVLKQACCESCKEQFLFVPGTEKGRFCSKDCRYTNHSEIIKESYTPELKQRKKDLAIKNWTGNDKRRKEMSEKHKVDEKQSYDYRIKAFASYPNECEHCSDTNKKVLVVHHKDRDFYNNDVENLQILCTSCHAKEHSKEKVRGLKFKEGQIVRGVRMMLDGFRVNLQDENFKNTPVRVLRSYKEIFEGLDAEKDIKELLSTAFPSTYEGLVIVEDIVTFSMCPHHLLPVEYSVDVGYVSKKKALGISKLPRLVELLAHKPVLQETFTREIVDTLMNGIGAEGAMAVVKGKHMCMRMRGIKKPESLTTTSCLGGIFKTDQSLKEEFALLTNLKNK